MPYPGATVVNGLTERAELREGSRALVKKGYWRSSTKPRSTDQRSRFSSKRRWAGTLSWLRAAAFVDDSGGETQVPE